MRRPVPVCLALAALVLAGCSSPPPAAAPAPSGGPVAVEPAPPGDVPQFEVYVALGDSLAAGYQPDADPGDPEASRRAGYAGLVGEEVAADLVNLGCPGETVGSFLRGGRCPYPEGSQAAAAEAVLAARPDGGAGTLVTVQVGANDVQRCVANVTGSPVIDEGCLTAGLSAVRQDLPEVLRRVRAAAPRATVVALDYYDPFVVSALLGPQAAPLAERSAQVLRELNAEVERAASAVDARVARVGDAFAATAPDGVTRGPTLEPVCSLTWMCAPVPDTHATDAGYAVMADEVLDALAG